MTPHMPTDFNVSSVKNLGAGIGGRNTQSNASIGLGRQNSQSPP
jgi:hypothetical protein